MTLPKAISDAIDVYQKAVSDCQTIRYTKFGKECIGDARAALEAAIAAGAGGEAMTTKPKSVLAWAVMDCDTNLPWLEMVTPDEVRANTWREMGHELLRVRITVVRERKRKATKRRAKR